MLGDRDVHVWVLRLDDGGELGPAAAEQLLTDAERTRAARFRRPEDRARYVLGRGGARRLVRAYGGGDLRHDGDGAPRARDLHVSIAHGGDVVLCALSRRPVGVDVEDVRGELPSPELLARCCTPGERRALLAAGLDERAFLSCWVVKEAAGKALGLGLARDPACVEVARGGRLRGVPGRWRARGLDVAGGEHVAAVVAPGHRWRLTTLTG